MSKIKNSNPKSSSRGFQRLLGDNSLADLMSRIQSAVISNGYELEKSILAESKDKNIMIDNLEQFLINCREKQNTPGVYLCDKKVLKKYMTIEQQPDFLVFDTRRGTCNVVELKDGDNFDTKKSKSEKESLERSADSLCDSVRPFKTEFFICCFNQSSREQIVKGLKSEFTEDEVRTGREFCELLTIDYNKIVTQRKSEAKENYDYVLSEIDEIRKDR